MAATAGGRRFVPPGERPIASVAAEKRRSPDGDRIERVVHGGPREVFPARGKDSTRSEPSAGAKARVKATLTAVRRCAALTRALALPTILPTIGASAESRVGQILIELLPPQLPCLPIPLPNLLVHGRVGGVLHLPSGGSQGTIDLLASEFFGCHRGSRRGGGIVARQAGNRCR